MMSNSSVSFQLRRQQYLSRRDAGVGDARPPTPAGSAEVADPDVAGQVRRIIAGRQLVAWFQPIVDLAQGRIFGHEGLIRGPSDSPLHSPLNLFSAAEGVGLREEVEHLARQVTLESFKRLALPGRLFLNVSPECLLLTTARSGATLRYIRELGLDPKRIVIELTENQPTFDFEMMREAVRHYRAMGFSIAIDDLGQGFSSLRLWSELRPEFVKIDRHFVQGVDGDAVKRQFLESLQEIAVRSGSSVIAEGIETRGEMGTVARAGVGFGQGYWFARPQAVPAVALGEATLADLRGVGQPRHSNRVDAPVVRDGRRRVRGPLATDVMRQVPVADRDMTTEEVFAIFEAHPQLQSLPVLHGGRPVGLISRLSLIDRYARPFRRELYGKKPCTVVMDAAPLLVDAGTSLQDLSFLLAEGDQRHLADGFLVVADGRYRGFGSGHDVVREITHMQIEAARHTNPLTGLPGNLPLNECIGAWLDAGADFMACYCDLDHFKPFNDVYGYSRGDELIRALADILRRQCDAAEDFIGHIGGDDFMVLFAGAAWEDSCRRILDEFERVSAAFFSAEDRRQGGYFTENREGQRVFVPLASLSLGVVHVEAARFSAYHQVAAAAALAKKEAKMVAGNSIFVERRLPAPGCAAEIDRPLPAPV